MQNTGKTGNKKSILLIYPFFKPKHDRSVFRFPPLGIAYIASSLRKAGHDVSILDCTFMDRDAALAKAMDIKAEIVGIYSMITMREDGIYFAKHLRGSAGLLSAGGPLPSAEPGAFLEYFDVVVKGEGERTMGELADAYERGADILKIPGIVFKDAAAPGGVRFTDSREFEPDLDSIRFPARELLPNGDYMAYGRKKYGYSITSVMTTRGCPFACEFCSSAVFGVSYRERSVENVLDEVEQALALGYDRIHFGDDVFTLKKERVMRFLRRRSSRRNLDFKWECLGRVDSMDAGTARAMKGAGCEKIYFGIESGNASVLRLMNKKITLSGARSAVEAAHGAGIKAGAFFILFYPGETDETVIATMRYAASLPLDYVSFTVPYPMRGTALYERVKDRKFTEWKQAGGFFSAHSLIFRADFSEFKMKFGIFKAALGFVLKKYLGGFAAAFFEKPTDFVLKLLR